MKINILLPLTNTNIHRFILCINNAKDQQKRSNSGYDVRSVWKPLIPLNQISQTPGSYFQKTLNQIIPGLVDRIVNLVWSLSNC